MTLITIFVLLIACFLIIGFVAAINYDRQDHGVEKAQSHIVISQEVPSVFDSFKRQDRK